MYYTKLYIFLYLIIIIIALLFFITNRNKLDKRETNLELPFSQDNSNSLSNFQHLNHEKFYYDNLSHLVIAGGGLNGINYIKLFIDIQKKIKNRKNNLKTILKLYSGHIKLNNNKIELIDINANKKNYNAIDNKNRINFKNAFFYKNRIYYLTYFNKTIPIQYTGEKYIFIKPKDSEWSNDFLELFNLPELEFDVQKDISNNLIIDQCSIFSTNSVGTLILLGLILRYSPIEILDLFDNFAKEIFDLNTFTELFLKPIRLTGVIGPKYSQRKIKNLISKWIVESPLSQMLKDQTFRYELELPYQSLDGYYLPYTDNNVFSNLKNGLTYDNFTFDLLDLIYPSKLFNIITYNLSIKSITIFSSYKGFSPDSDILINSILDKTDVICFTNNKILDICIASSAVPYFFEPVSMPNYNLKDNPNHLFADGFISGADIPINYGLILTLIILKNQSLYNTYNSNIFINTLILRSKINIDTNYKAKYGLLALFDIVDNLFNANQNSTDILTNSIITLEDLRIINKVKNINDVDSLISKLKENNTIYFDNIKYCDFDFRGDALSYEIYLKNKKRIFNSPDFFDMSLIDLDWIKNFLFI